MTASLTGTPSTYSTNSYLSSHSIPYPSGVASSGSSEALLMVGIYEGATAPDTPSGWTLVGSIDGNLSTYQFGRVYWIESNSQSGTFNWTGPSGKAHVKVFRIADTDPSTTPTLGTNNKGYGTTTVTLSAIGSPPADPFVLWIATVYNNGSFTAAPSGTTLEDEHATVSTPEWWIVSDDDNSTSDPGDFTIDYGTCNWGTAGLALPAGGDPVATPDAVATPVTVYAPGISVTVAAPRVQTSVGVPLPSVGFFYEARPSGAGTYSSTWTGAYTDIDDDPDSPTDADTAYGPDQGDDSWFFQLSLPSNFSEITGAKLRMRARRVGTTGGETRTYARLYEDDETTPLSDEVLVDLFDETATSYAMYEAQFTNVVSAGDWSNVRVRLRQAWAEDQAPSGPLAFSVQPSSSTEDHGTALPFSATYTGGTPNYTEQWQRSDDGGRTWTTVESTGGLTTPGTTQALTELTHAKDHRTWWRLRVTDDTTTITSNTVRLDVDPPTGATSTSTPASAASSGSEDEVFLVTGGTIYSQSVVPKNGQVFFCTGITFNGSASANHAFSGSAKDVVIIGGTFTNYVSPYVSSDLGYSGSSPARGGAIYPAGDSYIDGGIGVGHLPNVAAQGADWTLVGCTISDNAGSGLRVSSGMYCREITVTGNNWMGTWGGYANHTTATLNYTSRNYLLFVDSDFYDNSDDTLMHTSDLSFWESGNLKLGRCMNVRIYDCGFDNSVHSADQGPAGPGVWADIDCRDWEVDNCTFTNCTGNLGAHGVSWEISGGGDLGRADDGIRVTNCTFTNISPDGTRGNCYRFVGGAVRIQNAQKAIVENNTLVNCHTGIFAYTSDRITGGGDSYMAEIVGEDPNGTGWYPFVETADCEVRYNDWSGFASGCTSLLGMVGTYTAGSGYDGAANREDEVLYEYNTYTNLNGLFTHLGTDWQSEATPAQWAAQYPNDGTVPS